MVTGYQGNFTTKPIKILIGQTKSEAFPLNGFKLVGILLRAFTGTALTFEACDTIDGTFVPLKDQAGVAVPAVVAANGFFAIDPKSFEGVQFMKIVSGSAEAAERTLVVSLKG